MARARMGRSLPEIIYEDLCFDAQQAAEKATKAILVHRKVSFSRTHDIIDLLTLLQNDGVVVPDEIREADLLTEYAVETRYPGLSEEVTEQDYLQALELAERVIRWAESLLPPSP